MSLPSVSDSPFVAGRVENPVSFSDDEEDDTPLEPFFNYRLIEEKDVKNMLRDDKISSLAAHDKFLAIGTSQGYIYLMSHEGTMDHAHIPKIKAHRQPVARLDVELAGNYVISCANDARVVISGLGTDVLNFTLNLLWIPKSVAISPSFSRTTGPPQFAVGERNLLLYEKKFFKYNSTILFQGGEKDGFVNRVSWNGSYIAFTNDTGTRIYDTDLKKMITLISPSHDVDRIRSSRFPPSHCWLSQESLAIGWADTVTVIVIVDSERGITKGDWEKLVLFGLKPAEGDDETDFCDTSSMVSMQSLIDKGGPAPLIQVSVISPETERYYKLHSEDRLGLEANSVSQPIHFAMVGLPAFDSYFITGPKCLVSATPYGALNAVKWRLEKGLWEEAFDLAKQKGYELEETEYNAATVGRQMIEHYLSIGRPRLAAAKLEEVCGESRCEWEWAVQLFEQGRISTLLAEILPTSHPQLDKHCYEIVLESSLWNDPNLFRKLVQTWSSDLYGAGYISVLTLGRLQRAGTPGQDATVSLSQEDELNLYRALVHLYLYERKFEQAIKIYITMIKDVQIFNIIDKYQLFDLVKDQISDLMTIHTDRALRLLLDNEDAVSPHFVMSKLTQKPKLQMLYLNRLFSKGEGAEWADRAVQLYAEYDRKKLIKFLKNNEHYNILRALDICKQKSFHEETILLYGKSGNHREALLLMMKEYKQLDRAIEYCREHEDEDLWNQLIDLVVKSPEHIVGLLKQVGSSINPLNIIQKIPRDLEVKGLRDALAKVLRDCAARVELLRGCREATYSDTTILFTDFLKVNRRAFPLGPRSLCIVCRKRFMTEEASKWSDLIVFGCGHTSHVNCAESERKLHFRTGTCPLCSENREEILD